MMKYAPQYVADQENLEYWGGDVPLEVVAALGLDIIVLSQYLQGGRSLNKLYQLAVRNRKLSLSEAIQICLEDELVLV